MSEVPALSQSPSVTFWASGGTFLLESANPKFLAAFGAPPPVGTPLAGFAVDAASASHPNSGGLGRAEEAMRQGHCAGEVPSCLGLPAGCTGCGLLCAPRCARSLSLFVAAYVGLWGVPPF